MVPGVELEDLVSLPEGYRYDLHDGNLVVGEQSNFWHKMMCARLLLTLHAAGLDVLQDTGIRGDRPRDCRHPDIGVMISRPANSADYSYLPGSAFRLVIEIVSEESASVDYGDKALWYAERGIPEYWIVDRTPERSHDDALVHLHRLTLAGGKPAYARERTVRLSDLEAEYRSRQ